MAGLVPAIHVFGSHRPKTWMPGTRPDMTRAEDASHFIRHIKALSCVNESLPAVTQAPAPPVAG
jgi:hypothetical protein